LAFEQACSIMRRNAITGKPSRQSPSVMISVAEESARSEGYQKINQAVLLL
jgi:hypothetical protein